MMLLLYNRKIVRIMEDNMEPVDIYDCNRNKKGYKKVRGRDRLEPGEYII